MSYSWLLERDLAGVEINPADNNRYTITNGMLTIHEPDQNEVRADLAIQDYILYVDMNVDISIQVNENT